LTLSVGGIILISMDTNKLTHFTCMRHAGIIRLDEYQRHMDEAHDGRRDCVLQLTTAAVHAIVDGSTYTEATAKHGGK
jgi:hypothetical protein